MQTSAASSGSKRFPWIIYAGVLTLILLVAFAPVISVMIASAIAQAHGCTLNEGGAHPCVINGVDHGQTLVTMFVVGWFMLLTLPAGGFAFFVWAVVLIAHLVSRRRRSHPASSAAAAAAVFLIASLPVLAQSPSPKMNTDDLAMAQRAAGTFQVKLEPKSDDGGPKLPGRMTIAKTFQGDLDATSSGQMLTAMTAKQGSAGYVAIEKVDGTLSGRRGTFVLQHNGIMDRGEPRLSITVVPDSGTDELVGLTGEMTIKIEGEKHSYEFVYRFVRKD